MELLDKVEPETTVTVKKIEGGSDVKKSLEDLGVVEGVELTVISTEPIHVHSGAISLVLSGSDRGVIVSRGWGGKIIVEKDDRSLPLLQLEKGEDGIVKSIEGGKELKKFISDDLGIKPGEKIEFSRHLEDVTLVLKIGDSEVRMGEGQASKVLVEKDGELVQINYLMTGEKAKIAKILGGMSLIEKFDEVGFKEGKDITLVKRDAVAPLQKKGIYVTAKIGGELITIGRGLAEKISVE
ncbi:MAG: FeoA domain protein [Candidatus Methanolliviera sp. GoM_asphalt]|nr:MAG: FeoA domain protein [Candidatus Methanolliviera sp. GoM_asphalt]